MSSELYSPDNVTKVAEWQVERDWGKNNPEYMPEKAVLQFESLFTKDMFETTFPKRFGSSIWQEENPEQKDTVDYYSYENFKSAIEDMSRFKCCIEMRETMPSVFRIIKFDKIEQTQSIVFESTEFYSDLNSELEIERMVIDYGAFLSGERDTATRELCAFMSHAAFGFVQDNNTLYNQDDLQNGFYEREQKGFDKNTTTSQYVKKNDPNFVPYPDKSYHGRGPFGLSYNYNYGYFSAIMFGNRRVLLEKPELVSEKGQYGIEVALLFWMTPKTTTKISCHDIIRNSEVFLQNQKRFGKEACYGAVLFTILGHSSGNLPEEDPTIALKVSAYKMFLKQIGNMEVNEKCDTLGYM